MYIMHKAYIYIIHDICIHISLYVLHSTVYNTIIDIYSLIGFSMFYIFHLKFPFGRMKYLKMCQVLTKQLMIFPLTTCVSLVGLHCDL